MRPLLTAIVLMWFSICAYAEVDTNFWLQRWRSESTWVKNLPRDEQAVVIHLLLKQLTDRLGKDLMPLAKSVDQKIAVSEVFFDGVALLPELATQSPELRKTLEAYGRISKRFVNGQIKGSQLPEEMAKNDRQMDLVLATVAPGYYRSVPVQFKDQLARTSAAVVVTALKINGWRSGED